MKPVCVCLLALLAVPSAQAYRLTFQPFGDEPGFVEHIPDPVPEPIVFPVGLYDAKQPFDKPVVLVDGAPVRRPLFHSVVGDPADRALVLRDYQKNGFALPPFQLSAAFKRYQHLQFHDIDALRDLRLKKERATLEDYRRFVAEEIKLTTMLYINSQLASTQKECNAMINEYVDRLHRKALIEKPSA